MKTREAIQILKTHNEWRRDSPNELGSGMKMVDPTKLGIAIDKVVGEYDKNNKL